MRLEITEKNKYMFSSMVLFIIGTVICLQYMGLTGIVPVAMFAFAYIWVQKAYQVPVGKKDDKPPTIRQRVLEDLSKSA